MLVQASISKSRRTALLSLFAVLYTLLRLIPTFPMIGVAQTFSASDVMAPLYGLLLGPYIGGGSIILGTFLAIVFGRPVIFLGLDFLPATLGTMAVGFSARGKAYHVAAIYTVLLATFLINPLSLVLVTLPNGMPVPYNWLHFVALAVLVSPLAGRVVRWVADPSPRTLSHGLAVLCFIGTMTQHLTGSVLFETILGMVLRTIKGTAWPGIWTAIFYIYPIERTILTLMATLVGTALITSLRRSHLIGQDTSAKGRKA